MILEILSPLISGIALAALSWWTYAQRAQRATIHDLEIRLVRVEARADASAQNMTEVKSELADIRENMVRRHDLEAFRDQVCQRIEDFRRD